MFGDGEKHQTDPHFRDYVLFHEYFHGHTGRGVGAGHQTGWTALVAKLLQPRTPDGIQPTGAVPHRQHPVAVGVRRRRHPNPAEVPMHAMRSFALLAAVLSSPSQSPADEQKTSGRSGSVSSSKEKEKKPDYAKLLVGKWVRTDGPYAGTVMEYAAGGTYTTASVESQRKKMPPMTGTWKLKGDAIVQTLGTGRNLTDVSVTITTLTETAFRFKNKAGQEATYERVTKKGEKGKDGKMSKK